MAKKRTILVVAAALLFILMVLGASCAPASQDGKQDDQGKQQSELDKLTVEQKVGQMFLVGFEGTSVTPEIEQLFEAVHPGGVILFARNITGEDQLKTLIRDLQALALADSGQPLFIAIDQEGGQIVRIDWLGDDVSESQITDTTQAYGIGQTRARGLAQLGINLNLAPVLDMGVQGDFLTRYGRTFNGNAQQVGELGKAVISGQSDGGVFSTAKHFPGYGGITYDPENDQLPVMQEVPEIAQFKVASEASPQFIMTANVIYTQLDANQPFPLTSAGIGFLKDQMKGDYLVISDDLATKTMQEKNPLQDIVVLAAQAGVDVLLISGHQAGDAATAYNALLGAVQGGEIAQDEIDAHVSDILRLKEKITSAQP